MTKVQESKDCGNSPKNRFVQDVAIALETGLLQPEMIASNVACHGIADSPIEGLQQLERYLADRATPAAIVINHAISHGKVGAASGETTLANGHKRRFSHILEFTNTKANCVASIDSYS